MAMSGSLLHRLAMDRISIYRKTIYTRWRRNVKRRHATIGGVTETRIWDGAADLPLVAGRRPRPEIVALPADGLPSVPKLFTFMRDAELRFGALRMRIEEHISGVAGDLVTIVDVALRHPREARVTTTQPALGTTANYELWISDGDVVRTYSAPHRLGTERPVRPRVVGVSGRASRGLPPTSRVYTSLTALPMETLPETFVHPAGYCQNVLSTGVCRIVGLDQVGEREAVVLECDHPRTIEMSADRPDFRIRVAVDRADGVILRLEETIGGAVTRDARVTVYEPDAPLPPATFEFTFPTGTTMLF
jgi:outer membrane lipoprotein-sorting protein